jgi:hypothetical protein
LVGTLESGQWGAFVLQGNSQAATIAELFAGQDSAELQAGSYGQTWLIYTFNQATQQFDLAGLDDTLKQGEAFWMIQREFDSYTVAVDNLIAHADLIPIDGCASVDGCLSLPLTGSASRGSWAFIGSPFLPPADDLRISVADLVLKSTGGLEACQQGCDFATAVEAGIVYDRLLRYDADNNAYQAVAVTDLINPGTGHWLWISPLAEDTSLELIIPYIGPTEDDEGDGEDNDELAAIGDFQYSGAFRLTNGEFGTSTLDYAVGALAHNPINNSLYIAGRAPDQSVAEYPIVQPGMQSDVESLPESGAPLQNFVNLLDAAPNPQGIDRVTGLYWLDGSLIVNAEIWYDAAGSGTDTTLVVTDANNLAGNVSGYFQMQGRAQSAGYMGPIPEQWQSAFGAQHYTGWSSVYSITSRYSIGPSLWSFDANSLINRNTNAGTAIATQAHLNYPYSSAAPERHLSPGALDWAEQGTPGPFPPADSLWNPLSKGRYGFFIPGTRTFAVIGHTEGLQSGMGYKAVQSDGNLCGGPCPYDPADRSNYYWFYDVNEILSATNVYEPRPYAYGAFDVPFDANGTLPIIGATFDSATKTLYLAIENAAQLAVYDRPPLIVTYRLP